MPLCLANGPSILMFSNRPHGSPSYSPARVSSVSCISPYEPHPLKLSTEPTAIPAKMDFYASLFAQLAFNCASNILTSLRTLPSQSPSSASSELLFMIYSSLMVSGFVGHKIHWSSLRGRWTAIACFAPVSMSVISPFSLTGLYSLS